MRLELISVDTLAEIRSEVLDALKDVSRKKEADVTRGTQLAPLNSICSQVAGGGTRTLIIQKKVLDPDFAAEFAAYYSQQFATVERYCTRVHFFKTEVKLGNEPILDYLDRIDPQDYLGFVTLRPLLKSPIGATILASSLRQGHVCSDDVFPVHIAGRELQVKGTPFIQQDNAVGVCAQASIWMALRTLRKREGDRAFDPAQITTAATRVLALGRTRPNREGLTQQQMTEAIRAAGYSPHLVWLNGWQLATPPRNVMSDEEMNAASVLIHPYVESRLPVLLTLQTDIDGIGHAVVAIGHNWDEKPTRPIKINVPRSSTESFHFQHAASWTPNFLIHNDNSGPYLELPQRVGTGYSLQTGVAVIPLLPPDVFMSAEEAQEVALGVIADTFTGFIGAAGTAQEIEALAESLIVRLLLIDKRVLRHWAATEELSPQLQQELRLMHLPKRLWVFELHKSENYGSHGTDEVQKTLIGLVLIDSTGDNGASSILLMHLNLAELFPTQIQTGALVSWDLSTGAPSTAEKTEERGPARPVR